MANIKISELPSLATLVDTTVFSTVSAGNNYKLTGTVLKSYVRDSISLASPATASLGGALGYAPTTGIFTFTPADKTNLVNGSATLQLDSDGKATLPGHVLVEGVTSTGATGTGKFVFDNAPTFSGHPTIEGVTSTGATGTGKFVFDNAPTFSGNVTTSTLTVKDVRDTVYTGGSTTGTITPDCTNGAVQTITLTGSITLNAFNNPVSGQSMTLIITQGGAGSYTLTSSMKFAGGLKTLSTAVGSIDLLTISYIGTTYYASLVTGFA